MSANVKMIRFDKSRPVKFTWNTMSQVEKVLGVSIDEAIKHPSITRIQALVWGALLHENPDFTMEEVGEILDKTEDIKAALQAIGDAFNEAMGVKGKEKNRSAAVEGESGKTP